MAEQHHQRRNEHRAAGDGLGDEIARHHLTPRWRVLGGVSRASNDAVHVGWLLANRYRHRRVFVGGVGPDHAVVGNGGSGGVERGLVGALIEHLRLRVLLGCTNSHVVAADHLADLRRWVVEVANDDRLGRTHDLTRRFEVLFETVVAHVALVRSVGLRVDVQRVVGARVHARLTTNAIVVLEIDHTVVGAKQRRGWADRHARCVFTLIAPHHVELARYIGKRTRLDVFHPRAVYAKWNVMFALASNGAGVAANAIITVQKKAEFCHATFYATRHTS